MHLHLVAYCCTVLTLYRSTLGSLDTHNRACELCCDRIAGCWLQDGGFKFTAGKQRGCEVFCTLDGCVLPGSSYLDGVSMSGVVHCL